MGASNIYFCLIMRWIIILNYILSSIVCQKEEVAVIVGGGSYRPLVEIYTKHLTNSSIFCNGTETPPNIPDIPDAVSYTHLTLPTIYSV